MQLYTVTLKRKIMTTIFGGRNNKEMTREERFVEEVYSDLPYVTALTYQKKFPDNFVRMEQQAETFYRKEARKHATRVRDVGTKSLPTPKQEKIATPKAAAIHAGSYADAINAAVKREAGA